MQTATVLPSLKEVREVNKYHVCQKLHPESHNDMFWIRFEDGGDKHFKSKQEAFNWIEQSLRTWEIDEESLYMENIKFHSGIRELTAGQEVQGEIRNGKFWIF